MVSSESRVIELKWIIGWSDTIELSHWIMIDLGARWNTASSSSQHYEKKLLDEISSACIEPITMDGGVRKAVGSSGR